MVYILTHIRIKGFYINNNIQYHPFQKQNQEFIILVDLLNDIH